MPPAAMLPLALLLALTSKAIALAAEEVRGGEGEGTGSASRGVEREREKREKSARGWTSACAWRRLEVEMALLAAALLAGAAASTGATPRTAAGRRARLSAEGGGRIFSIQATCSSGCRNLSMSCVAALPPLWGMSAIGGRAWRGSNIPSEPSRSTIHSASIRTTAPLPSTGSSSRPPNLSDNSCCLSVTTNLLELGQVRLLPPPSRLVGLVLHGVAILASPAKTLRSQRAASAHRYPGTRTLMALRRATGNGSRKGAQDPVHPGPGARRRSPPSTPSLRDLAVAGCTVSRPAALPRPGGASGHGPATRS
ncbi:unnamed protein product [Prorocentrum cordatum]|uniref:Uncharacterized protein n=1 Tax=Prorocentrum cordatum TaxID=2364126 RepID=A0ABN9SZL6_9DINO|nr:unnamed protein product [Polarella glacialis]